ncbi:uncharacterized protein METZ01_LOCUS265962 [marine metagenome]|uniref:Uncharacterized protein n=1 Tax=marine metagenome TaxID=408172 RepID=A0A382JMW3_9ZZZZ
MHFFVTHLLLIMLLWQVRTEKRKQRKPQGRYERETEAEKSRKG